MKHLATKHFWLIYFDGLQNFIRVRGFEKTKKKRNSCPLKASRKIAAAHKPLLKQICLPMGATSFKWKAKYGVGENRHRKLRIS